MVCNPQHENHDHFHGLQHSRPVHKRSSRAKFTEKSHTKQGVCRSIFSDSALLRAREKRTQLPAQQQCLPPTCQTVEETQCWSVSPILVDHAFLSCFGHRDGEGDGFMELATAWLHSHNRTHSHPVTKQFGHQFWCNGLSLTAL